MRIRTHDELEVYRLAYSVAMETFGLSRSFPKEERYALTDQIRRSSRSVCANLAEAFRKRRYPRAFVSKLSGAEAEIAETQVWLEFAVDCGYIAEECKERMAQRCDRMLASVVTMINKPTDWIL